MNDAAAPLKVLLIEDSAADAELILRALRERDRPVEHRRVSSEADLRTVLAEFGPDVILSDFAMPGFSGPEALGICSEQSPEVPFLFVSGTIGEERAIDALQSGASDYVLKDNLARLPSAVRRAIHEARNRLQRQIAEQALFESEERFRSIVETSDDWIWEGLTDTTAVYTNGAIARILGYQPHELLGTPATELMLPEDRKQVEERLPKIVAAREGWRRWRLRWRHRNGSIRVLESTATPRLDENGELIGFRGLDHDITESLEREARIRHLARIHSVLGALGTAVLRAGSREALLRNACQVAVENGGFRAACISVRDPDANTIRVVSSYGDSAVLAQVAPEEPISLSDPDTYARHPAIRAYEGNRTVIVRDFGESGESPQLREEMRRVGVAAQATIPIGADAMGLLVLYSDEPQEFGEEEMALLERLAGEIDFASVFIANSERLEFLAYHNPVSELFNRVAFHERLDPMLQEPVCVAVADVERFSAINESRGRAFGDALLSEVGARLRALVGASTLIAHPEADNFALAYRASGTAEAELQRLEGVLDEFEKEPFEVEGQEVRLGIRAGIALAPDHGRDAETLENNAGVALGEAKKRGLRVFGFNEELRGRAARRMAMEHELRVAIETGQFELYFQPKFNAPDQRLVGAEALLRWRHPERGLVSPAEFIPLLEESALIERVGHWVMEEALRTALAWRLRRPGLRIAVNVSAREMRHVRFLEHVRTLLQPHAADQLLDIEVTESMLMDDIDSSMHLLDSLRDMGCRVAIDDFGTGYSSLNYLARLPVDTIKIDQSFIGVLTENPQTLALVTNMIGLAHSLSLDVVAEGVEEEGQAHLLRLLRCDILQGYLLGRPMPAAEFEARLLGAEPAAVDNA
jgi:PAS domain S-box-containing protein/diguanylate cyclase (GGDEF)-like protein